MKPRTLATIRAGQLPKGDMWSVAQVAGVLATKRTAELIPLRQPVLLSRVDIRQEPCDGGLAIEATVATTSPTTPELEALTAVAVAALTIYDMCKVVERGIVIRRLHLVMRDQHERGDGLMG